MIPKLSDKAGVGYGDRSEHCLIWLEISTEIFDIKFFCELVIFLEK